jgi:uncharacterized repeat protein (TIGR04138 family)
MDNIHSLRRITERDTRYPLEAYLFVLEALFHTRRMFKLEKHASGRELLEGVKDLALSRYGSMAKIVFEHWGIKETIDFGHIVFNMVDENILSKTTDDRLTDFEDVFNFEDVFEKSYRINVGNPNNPHSC